MLCLEGGEGEMSSWSTVTNQCPTWLCSVFNIWRIATPTAGCYVYIAALVSSNTELIMSGYRSKKNIPTFSCVPFLWNDILNFLNPFVKVFNYTPLHIIITYDSKTGKGSRERGRDIGKWKNKNLRRYCLLFPLSNIFLAVSVLFVRRTPQTRLRMATNNNVWQLNTRQLDKTTVAP
jgi:hypothetical protein